MITTKRSFLTFIFFASMVALAIFTFSKIATAQTVSLVISGPISGPISPSPSASASPSTSPTTSPTASPTTSPTASPTVSPSVSPSPTPNVVDDEDRARGNLRYTASGLERRAIFSVEEAENDNIGDNDPAKGNFRYSDENDQKYRVDISCVRVVGDTAWFEGQVESATNPSWVGQWLFAKVEDNVRPGAEGDLISGSFVSPDPSCSRTNSMQTPSDGPFVDESGDIRVNDKD